MRETHPRLGCTPRSPSNAALSTLREPVNDSRRRRARVLAHACVEQRPMSHAYINVHRGTRSAVCTRRPKPGARGKRRFPTAGFPQRDTAKLGRGRARLPPSGNANARGRPTRARATHGRKELSAEISEAERGSLITP